jgi:hypothetical protein
MTYLQFYLKSFGDSRVKIRCILCIFTLSFLSPTTSYTQINVNSVSVHFGAIRTLFPAISYYSGHLYAFYPELQVGGRFFTHLAGWTVYWGYWTDGVEEPFPVMDMTSYSYSSHIVGTRLTFFPTRGDESSPHPIGIFVGISHHFIAARCIGGSVYNGNPEQNYTRTSNTIEIGLNIRFPILSPLGIMGEVHQYFPIDNSEIDRIQKYRRAYKIGFVLSL